ncbi:MAG TPA: hypothetical protein VGO93_08345 [Candidatus Xenobia bacterium]
MKRLMLMLALGTLSALGASGWHYRNHDYGFGLQLPSPGWKQVSYPQGVVAFRGHDGEVGVLVRNEDQARYQASVQNFHHVMTTLPNLLQKPRFEETHTRHGCTVSYAELIEMSPDRDQPVVVGVAHLRLPSGNTVVTTFQSTLSVQHNKLDLQEVSVREGEAHTICLSVDQE